MGEKLGMQNFKLLWSLQNMFLHDLQLEHWRLSQIVGPLNSHSPKVVLPPSETFVGLDSPHELVRCGFVWKWSTRKKIHSLSSFSIVYSLLIFIDDNI